MGNRIVTEYFGSLCPVVCGIKRKINITLNFYLFLNITQIKNYKHVSFFIQNAIIVKLTSNQFIFQFPNAAYNLICLQLSISINIVLMWFTTWILEWIFSTGALLFFCVILYPANNRVGIGNLVLKHVIPYFYILYINI